MLAGPLGHGQDHTRLGFTRPWAECLSLPPGTGGEETPPRQCVRKLRPCWLPLPAWREEDAQTQPEAARVLAGQGPHHTVSASEHVGVNAVPVGVSGERRVHVGTQGVCGRSSA